ncbi:MAG TPA: tRNA (adenosine(37)-N6)-threonylcarbamoyltransferase complex ATPase subunit type 1 TsaE [Phycisphaerae bacterium]|nr:tRNA (adenosine(37)-N6)-threonylcarbamoyltransferase complex ATPase subunit type 1 TsaE [Phycisphaerae bacterium]HRR84363.1 tRNA (adenosine(37)-N6)-threonylcarbamoyltransferase complex ATPase subunit type 1 TsaE [Phycisphaerae bacterium]
MNQRTINIADVEATRRLGRRLGSALQAGDLVALIGPLGSGKTTLVKGIAAGAGVADSRQVNSPTFVIVNEYETGLSPAPRIYHIDAYRLRGGGDLESLGFDEMLSLGAVLIEWADRVQGVLPSSRLEISIEPVDENRRRFLCRAFGSATRLLDRLGPDERIVRPAVNG